MIDFTIIVLNNAIQTAKENLEQDSKCLKNCLKHKDTAAFQKTKNFFDERRIFLEEAEKKLNTYAKKSYEYAKEIDDLMEEWKTKGRELSLRGYKAKKELNEICEGFGDCLVYGLH